MSIVNKTPQWIKCILVTFTLFALAIFSANAETLTNLSLQNPIAFKVSNRNELTSVAGLVIRDAKSDIDSNGKLYLVSVTLGGLFQSNTYNSISLENIQKIEYFRVSSSGYDDYALTTLKNGTQSKEKLVSLRWCGVNVDPITNLKDCYLVKNYIDEKGRELPLFGMKTGSGSLTGIFIGKDDIAAEVEKIATTTAAYNARKENEARAAQAANKKIDEERLRQIASAQPGTQDFCTSVSLLAPGTPIRPSTWFKCGTFERASIEELRNANWDVQLSARTSTKGQYEYGDSVDITIVKRR